MAPHSSTLAWKIPWTEEPGGLQSMGSLGVGCNWATSLSLFTFMHWRMRWQPTPVFLPGESQGRGSLVGCRLWGRTESDTTDVTWQQQQSTRNRGVITELPILLTSVLACGTHARPTRAGPELQSPRGLPVSYLPGFSIRFNLASIRQAASSKLECCISYIWGAGSLYCKRILLYW